MTDPPHPHFPKQQTERQILYTNVSTCLVPGISQFPYKGNIPRLHSSSVVNSLSFPYSSTISCCKKSALKSLEKVFLNSRCDFLQRVIPVAVCESQYSNSLRTNEEGQDFSFAENTEEEGLPGMRYRRQKTSPLPSNITEVELNSWLENETGMDRLRMMYSIRPDGHFVQEDTQIVQTMFHRTIVIGFFLNVFKASKTEYKQKDPSTQARAGTSNPKSGFRGILKEASVNTLRLTVFAGCLLHLSQAIAAYRNKSSVWEYTFSSALAFGSLGIGKSLKSLAVNTAGGAVIGTLMGLAVYHVLTSNGITQEQRHAARVQHLLREQHLDIENGKQLDPSSEKTSFNN